ncbi:MAG: hemolysin III family protein [Acidimicrobiales bacterium]|nr:hemolysin III family protein [Acidimicrobiales bacterium]
MNNETQACSTPASPMSNVTPTPLAASTPLLASLPALAPIGPLKPLLRGRLHQGAFVASLFGLVWLVEAASTPRARAVAWVYGMASVLLYLTSSSYHVFARSPKARKIMQRADHSMIYVLIAGTFTPAAVLAVSSGWKWVALVAVWTAAVVGIVIKIVALDRFPKLGGTLYIVLGWAGVLLVPALWDHPGTLALILVGGVLYTIGATLFAMQKPVLSPRVFGYHEVWHTFGILAGVALFAANLGLIRAG